METNLLRHADCTSNKQWFCDLDMFRVESALLCNVKDFSIAKLQPPKLLGMMSSQQTDNLNLENNKVLDKSPRTENN